MDENNRSYFYFTREEIAESARVSLSTAKRCIKQLVEHELLEEKRQGLNKPNKLYLLQPDLELIEEEFSKGGEEKSYSINSHMENKKEKEQYGTRTSSGILPAKVISFGTSEADDHFQRNAQSSVKASRKIQIDTSLMGQNNSFRTVQNEFTGQFKMTLPESSGWTPRELNTRDNKYINNLHNTHSLTSSSLESTTDVLTMMKNRVEYDSFAEYHKPIVDTAISIAIDVFDYSGKTFRIGHRHYSAQKVKQSFRELDRKGVEQIVDAVSEAEKISNYRNFIISIVYNNFQFSGIRKEQGKSHSNGVQMKNKNKFCDFDQRKYDYDELLRKINP